MATKKSDRITKLLAAVPLSSPIPEVLPDASLLEHGMYAVLLRHLPATKAKSSLNAMQKAFPDWNELRVSQAQEIADAMTPRGKGKTRPGTQLSAAQDVKEYLAQVFQETHGLDLEFLRTDPAGGAKQLANVPILGNELTAFLAWIAEDGALPVSGGMVRVLDRMGAMTRTTSMKKARAALEPMVPAKDGLRFGMSVGLVADRWCDARKPLCWECPLAPDCPMGKKVVKDWEAQQKRLAVQRAKEEARAEAARKKEEARLAREAERERKRLEKEAEKERKRAEREAAAEARRKEAEKQKAAVAKKKAAAKKKADAAKKKAAAKKKVAAKKTKVAKARTTKKKTTAKKATKKVAKKAAKKTTRKKAARTTKKRATKTTRRR